LWAKGKEGNIRARRGKMGSSTQSGNGIAMLTNEENSPNVQPAEGALKSRSFEMVIL
jgi:hypothetical protein